MKIQYTYDTEIKNKVFRPEELMYNEFENCIFRDCDFSACDFLAVVFVECTFYSCNFNAARINYVCFRTAIFIDTDFTGVNFSMCNPLVFEVHFESCTLDFSKFYNLKMKRTTFKDCRLIAVDFMNADLTEAVFSNCDLYRAVFDKTTLIKADFMTAYNFAIHPEKNKLKKALFSRMNLKGLLDTYEIQVF